MTADDIQHNFIRSLSKHWWKMAWRYARTPTLRVRNLAGRDWRLDRAVAASLKTLLHRYSEMRFDSTSRFITTSGWWGFRAGRTEKVLSLAGPHAWTLHRPDNDPTPVDDILAGSGNPHNLVRDLNTIQDER
tara:strand:+ start:1331 stop:1726 length:396 start_codon:yes stop_codon:yes gene_type:complete